MQFQHPELLYALFLLIIPLLVHLFRLRKFQKEDFTNVKFLKKVIKETRRSSKLKKFLILTSRLLLIACLVLAFAQPFIPASDKALANANTLVYLDNSFSMQATTEQSSLLHRSINHLLDNLREDISYGVFTNNSEYFNHSTSVLRKKLQEVEFTGEQIDIRQIQLKTAKYFKNSVDTENNLVIISDFQNFPESTSALTPENINYHFIDKRPDEILNISIDSAYIEDSNIESLSLRILLKANNAIEDPVSISIFDDQDLLGRNTITKFENGQAAISFRLQNKEINKGKIEIEDSGLQYDNELFFNINKSDPIKTVIIADSEIGFLQRIYTEPEFKISNFTSNQVDYNQLNEANLIILNEIDQISSSLVNNLNNVHSKGTSIIIIPSEDSTNYSEILNSFGFNAFGEKVAAERLITSITYDHPLLQDVFEDRTENFEYPKVMNSYNLNSSSSILKYQDGHAFLLGTNSIYLFTAALNTTNSNFINSPLVVPVFYQIGLNSLKKNELYYKTNSESTIEIPLEIGKDQVLHISKSQVDVIPQQQNLGNRVEISTNNISLEAGNYEISNTSSPIGNISFNYDRNESDLSYAELSKIDHIQIYDSVRDYFSKSNAASQITALWKWFVIFAMIFLVIEMLLIKLLK